MGFFSLVHYLTVSLVFLFPLKSTLLIIKMASRLSGAQCFHGLPFWLSWSLPVCLCLQHTPCQRHVGRLCSNCSRGWASFFCLGADFLCLISFFTPSFRHVHVCDRCWSSAAVRGDTQWPGCIFHVTLSQTLGSFAQCSFLAHALSMLLHVSHGSLASFGWGVHLGVKVDRRSLWNTVDHVCVWDLAWLGFLAFLLDNLFVPLANFVGLCANPSRPDSLPYSPVQQHW